MKRRVRAIVCVAVAALMCFAMAACGGGGGGKADDTVYQVDVAVTLGEPVSPHWSQILEGLEETSGGRFNVTFYWSGSLLPIPEIPKSMRDGLATFANVPTPNYPDVLPLNCRIVQLPFIGLQDPVESAEIYMQLLDEFPQMQEELGEYNMIALGATTLGMYGMHLNSSKEVHQPADIKGLKLVPYNTALEPMFQKNGAAVSYIPPGEIFVALQNKVQDGYVNNWAFQGWFGLTDVVTQHVDFGDYGMFHEFNLLVINADFYNSLPADLQKMWVDAIRTNRGYADMWLDTADLVAGEQAKAEGKNDIWFKLTPAELEAWKSEILPIHQTVLDEINAQRGDTVANDIYARLKEIVAEKYGA